MEHDEDKFEKPTELSEEEFELFCKRLEESNIEGKDKALIVKVFKTMSWMTRQLELGRLGMGRLRKLLFGKKSEKKESIFPEKKKRDSKTPDEQIERIKGHGRNPVTSFTGAETVFCPHDKLKSQDTCPECKKGKLHSSIKNGVFLRLVGNPLISATIYETEKLRCAACGKIYEAPLPKGVPAVKWDETACSMAALSRYGYGIPHYRSEKMQEDFGIPISDSVFQALSSDVAKCGEPIVEWLTKLASQGKLIHSDDTNMRILDLMQENKSRDPKKDRVGIFTTAILSLVEDREIALFITGRKHTGENLEELLKKRAQGLKAPMLMVDGSSRNIPDELIFILLNCFTHGRRQFLGLEESFPDEIKYVIELFSLVYQYDAEARNLKLNDKERLKYHQEKSAPVMQTLKTWCHTQIADKKTEPNSGLGKAIAYMEKRWEELTVFLRVEGAPLSNDVVERLIKRCVLHRKNSLFYWTLEGAKVGDTLMTLIHTATRAKANPFDYLTEIQRHTDKVKENPSAWLPWNYKETLKNIS